MPETGLIVSAAVTERDVARIVDAGRRLGARLLRRPVADHAEFLAAIDAEPETSFILADYLPDPTADRGAGLSMAFSRVVDTAGLTPAARDAALRRVAGVRWIQLGAAGVNQEAASFVWRDASSIIVTTASGLPSVAMAQYIAGAILDAAHGFSRLAAYRAARDWSVRASFRARVLVGSTVGLLGYGGVGRRAAHIATALGMRVVAIRRTSADEETPQRYRVPAIEALDADVDPAEVRGPEALDWLLRNSDYLVCTLPLTAETQGLIGARELGLLPHDAYLINVSRGGIFDEPALIAALRDGVIRGATLDVFATEPLPPDSELWDLPNVVLTPHSSGTHDRVSPYLADLFIENMERFLTGRPLLNMADRTRGY